MTTDIRSHIIYMVTVWQALYTVCFHICLHILSRWKYWIRLWYKTNSTLFHIVPMSMRWQWISAVTSSTLLPCEKYWLPPKFRVCMRQTFKRINSSNDLLDWMPPWWSSKLFHMVTMSMTRQRIPAVTSSNWLPCENSWLPPMCDSNEQFNVFRW